jgi:hypothetical protein
MFLMIDRMDESFPWPDHPPCDTANANLPGVFHHLRDCDAALYRPSQRWIVDERGLSLLLFHMFAGAYGGNRIKCRSVHHDPVLAFGIRSGLATMSAAIMPRMTLRTVAGMPQRGAKTELSTGAVDLKFLQFRRQPS